MQKAYARFLYAVFLGLLALIGMILLRNHLFWLFFVLGVISGHMIRTRDDLMLYVLTAILGTIAMMSFLIFVSYQLFTSIPLWTPLAWGILSIILKRLDRSIRVIAK
ncbi:hypothetical protein JW968_04085 [Candidatus Woesearchaeota archaeon]|nr:hypothetical protein [Candidatus Woesearchaeota archaeon]